MLKIENKEKFNRLVSEAIERVATTVENEGTARRWVNAITKAADQIEENGDFMTYDADARQLLIWNQETNNIHAANGVCDCKAYLAGHPCFHRAAARLVRLYHESEAAPAAMSSAPYIKRPTGKRPERCGGIRF